jgi:DNA-binding LacI/PurR family transcriptional regulator
VRKTIACFNFADSEPSDLTAGTSIRHAFTAMEHELHNHHLRISFQDPHKIDLFLRPDTLAKSNYPGIIVSGITEARFTALHPRLVALDPALARSGKRLLFCGTHPQERLPKRIHYFCHGTVITNAVRTAADYCFSRGFQDIVLLFREKLEGISNVRFLVRFISESLMRNPRVRISFLIQPRDDTRSPERLFKQTASYRTSGHFEYLEGLLSKYAPMSMNDLYKLVTMDGSMEKLLGHAPKGAVWLCGDAATARWCISWCRSRRMPVPSAAAILCFDEDPSLAVDGIASCVPDWHTIGYLMAHALINDIPIKRSRKGFLQTPAVLCERETMP